MYIFNNVVLFEYFLIFLTLCLSSFIATIKKLKNLDSIVFVFSIVFFIFFITQRNGLGVDEKTYLDAYESYLIDPETYRFEFGFLVLFKIYSALGIETDYFNNATALIMLLCSIGMVKSIVPSGYRGVSFIIISFTSIYVDFMFNAYRQGFSCIFLILSLHFFNYKKYIRGVFFSILSLGFHWSAAIIVIFYLMSLFVGFRFLIVPLLLSLILHISAILINIDLLSIVNSSIFEKLNIKVLSNAINKYINAGDESFYTYTLFWKISTVFPMIALLFFIAYNWNKVLSSDPISRLVIILSCYCFMLINMAYSFRNYYWVIPFTFLVVNRVFTSGRSNNFNYIFIYVFIVLNGVIGFFNSSIIPMVYKYA